MLPRQRSKLCQRRRLCLAILPDVGRQPRDIPKDLLAQCVTKVPQLAPTCAGSHHPGGPKANHALTFKLDHPSGAAQDHAFSQYRVGKMYDYGLAVLQNNVKAHMSSYCYHVFRCVDCFRTKEPVPVSPPPDNWTPL